MCYAVWQTLLFGFFTVEMTQQMGEVDDSLIHSLFLLNFLRLTVCKVSFRWNTKITQLNTKHCIGGTFLF